MGTKVNVIYLDNLVSAIRFVAIVATMTIVLMKLTNHIPCLPIYRPQYSLLYRHLVVKTLRTSKSHQIKCARQFILQMESHICMGKYGERVDVPVGALVRVDLCTNGNVIMEKLSLLNPASQIIFKEGLNMTSIHFFTLTF